MWTVGVTWAVTVYYAKVEPGKDNVMRRGGEGELFTRMR